MATVESLLRPQKGAGSLNPGVAQTVLQSDRYKPAWRGWWVFAMSFCGFLLFLLFKGSVSKACGMLSNS